MARRLEVEKLARIKSDMWQFRPRLIRVLTTWCDVCGHNRPFSRHRHLIEVPRAKSRWHVRLLLLSWTRQRGVLFDSWHLTFGMVYLVIGMVKHYPTSTDWDNQAPDWSAAGKKQVTREASAFLDKTERPLLTPHLTLPDTGIWFESLYLVFEIPNLVWLVYFVFGMMYLLFEMANLVWIVYFVFGILYLLFEIADLVWMVYFVFGIFGNWYGETLYHLHLIGTNGYLTSIKLEIYSSFGPVWAHIAHLSQIDVPVGYRAIVYVYWYHEGSEVYGRKIR